MARSEDEREIRLRQAKPRIARNEGAAWSSGFKLLMLYARTSRTWSNRAQGGKGKGSRSHYQRCAVRVTYPKNWVSGQWRAHGRYLERGSAAVAAFSADERSIGVSARLQQWQSAGDRQLWKLIVSPELGDRVDLERLTREILLQMGRDLGTKLEWMAVEHHNAEHPHVHVVLRGVREDGEALRMSREYVQQGICGVAADLCTRQLGYRTELDAEEAERREIGEIRFTSIDRRLLQDAKDFVIARNPAVPGIKGRHDLSRLAVLRQMGLAEPIAANAWRLHNDMEQVLKAMQRTADRQRTLAAHGALLSDERLPVQVLDLRTSGTVEGRVLVHGQEEQSGKNFLMLEGTDARVHFISYTSEIEEARSRGELRANSFVRLRKVPDATILEVTDLGDSRKILTNRHFLANTAKEFLNRGVNPAEDGWGGWLGSYQAALRRAALELPLRDDRERLPTPRRERSSNRGR